MTRILSAAVLSLLCGSAYAASFPITVTDPAALAGLTAARVAYCASLPPVSTTDKAGKVPAVCDLDTDAKYLAQRVADMLASYAKQFDTAGSAKAAYLATLPPAKQAAVAAAVATELAKP